MHYTDLVYRLWSLSSLCNPLGAKRGKHKITAVYYMLGNIHPRFRSQQHLIHLALLVKHKYVKECGSDYAAVMQPLLHDLNSLQLDGITVSVNGCKRIVKGKLIAVSADNLTAHALGGFHVYFPFCLTLICSQPSLPT